ncbi:MAG TPA: protein kinase [Blastocatellia bacterium]|nr:protein kinase [Blastocatellia bacterium]
MHSPDRLQKIEELFHAARELEPQQRAGFLSQACADDPALRAEVESLLAEHEEPGGFIDSPAWEGAAELLTQADPQPPAKSLVGQVIGHYHIKAPLGRGGMGEVWLAYDTALGRRVALKLLPAEFTRDAELVRRFELEARAASALNHPNILTIHEIGKVDELHFIATEYIEGVTLRRRLLDGRMSLTESLDVMIQAAAALAASHEAGVIHRDIKPENIMLRPDGYVKVLDFGLARVTRNPSAFSSTESEFITRQSTETAPGRVMGTVSYMSPEQTRGQRVDARTDIWSLGVVLYEMLAGWRPFEAGTVPDIFVAILERQPPPVASRLPQAPPELERVITKALAKDREQRYATAQELGNELKALRRRLEYETAPAPAAVTEDPAQETPTLTPAPKATAPEVAIKKEAKAAAQSDPESGATQPLVGQLTEPQKINIPGPAIPALVRQPKLGASRLLIGAATLLALIVIGLALWKWSRPAPAGTAPSAVNAPAALPERAMSYSLTVQKMRDGNPYQEPFESSGQEIFENGWQFRLNFSSPQPGFLYLLNEGPLVQGAITFNYLFPTPKQNKGQSQVAAGQKIQTGQYVFDEHQGTEKFWLIWSANPVSELELLKSAANQADKGVISDPNQIGIVRSYLSQHSATKPEIEKDKARKQTNVKARGDVLVSLIELEHH